MTPATIYYATKSPFKKEELAIASESFRVTDRSGKELLIGEVCNFQVTPTETAEPLKIDLVQMVQHKVKSAYEALLMPCIVEHAGIVLTAHASSGFPGGLTQPMWDALAAEGFLSRTGAAGEEAIARAVIGYCDGTSVHTFVGETKGRLASEPQGDREFYWDTVFCPDGGEGLTYAQICAEKDGLRKKLMLSQSSKALQAFATYVARHGSGPLFSGI